MTAVLPPIIPSGLGVGISGDMLPRTIAYVVDSVICYSEPIANCTICKTVGTKYPNLFHVIFC